MVWLDVDGDPLRFLLGVEENDYTLEFDVESEEQIEVFRELTLYRLTLFNSNGEKLGDRLESVESHDGHLGNHFYKVSVWRDWGSWQDFVQEWLGELSE